MRLTIDFETRSRAPLLDCGMHRYAEDPSTEVMCLALKEHGKEPVLWVPPKFEEYVKGIPFEGFVGGLPLISKDEVEDLIARAEEIEAHNAAFEEVIWRLVFRRLHGFGPLPIEKLRCSAAKAATCALPRALGQVGQVLNIPFKKNVTGNIIMKKMCKPNVKTGEFPFIPEEYRILCAYCLDDTIAEESLSDRLPDLTPEELAVWQLDLKINNRGIGIDLDAVTKLKNIVNAWTDKLTLELQEVTGGKIKTGKQVAAIQAWLQEQGVEMASLNKEDVLKALTKDLPAPARRVLELRQSLGKACVSKLDTMLECVSSEDRVRGAFLYHGAGPGRWSGKMVQFQNFPRDSFGDEDVEAIIEMSPDDIEFLYGCPIQTSGKCLRGMIKAKAGHEFLVADSNAIEARGNGWLAGETKVLEAFEQGRDIYVEEAMGIYHTDKISKPQRQIGKVTILACGYQGHVGAFQMMAKSYGVVISDEEAAKCANAFRARNKKIVALWHSLEDAALQTVKTGKSYRYRYITFSKKGKVLRMHLPSGRIVYYPFCGTKMVARKGKFLENGALGAKEASFYEKETITFWGVDAKTKKWCEQKTYGGALTENAVQGIARDCLVFWMQRAEEEGLPVILHCHDELVTEVPIGSYGLKDFEALVSEVPPWAVGLPLKAEGYISKRYRK